MTRSSLSRTLVLVGTGSAYTMLLVRWFRDPAFVDGGARQTSVWPFLLLFAASVSLAAFSFRRTLSRMRGEGRGAWGLAGRDFAAWALVIAVSFLFQVPTMLFPAALLHSDAAINGLMAMHIASGRVAPAFYYGQEFMGTLFSHALGLLFVVTGPFVAGVAVMTWVFYAGFLTATFFLVRQATGLPVAFATALWLALAPSSLLIMMARSEYPQLFLLAASSLAVFAARTAGRVREDSWWLVVGVLLGLAFWSHPLASLVAVAMGGGLVMLLPARAAAFAALRIGLGFAVGVAPAVVGWGSRIGRFTEWFLQGGGRGGEETMVSAWGGMMQVSLPNIMLGGEGRAPVSMPLAMLVAAAIAISTVTILVGSLRARSRAATPESDDPAVALTPAAAALPVCLFVLLHFVVLVARRYDVVPAQYVIALHIGVPAVVAIGFHWLLRDRLRHAAGVVAALVVIWAGVPLPASISWLRTLPENQASMNVSIAALQAAGMESCFAPYWDAYRLSYLTLERIVCESVDVVRVPGYADEVARRSGGDRPAFVAAPQRENALRRYGQSLETGGMSSSRLETPRFIALMPRPQ